MCPLGGLALLLLWSQKQNERRDNPSSHPPHGLALGSKIHASGAISRAGVVLRGHYCYVGTAASSAAVQQPQCPGSGRRPSDDVVHPGRIWRAFRFYFVSSRVWNSERDFCAHDPDSSRVGHSPPDIVARTGLTIRRELRVRRSSARAECESTARHVKPSRR